MPKISPDASKAEVEQMNEEAHQVITNLLSPELQAHLEQGIADAKAGRVKNLGSFAQYADIDLEEEEDLNPVKAEAKRLGKRPSIDHLQPGVVNGEPQFKPGDRIVVERRASLLKGNPWLDTRVYNVKSINAANGHVQCRDWEQHPEHGQLVTVSYTDDFMTIKLCPKSGDPFKVPVAEKPRQTTPLIQQAGEEKAKKRKGRPKGSKNRSKAEIKADKEAKKAVRAAKKARRQQR